MDNIKILIVEDEDRMRRLIRDYLKKEGYTVIEAEDGKLALEKFFNDDIDLVILDIMLPEYDGWTVMREIRKKSNVPIIILTARSEESDELFGFELGADEYVTKPFSPKVLVARVKALLRRSNIFSEKDILKIGSLELDLNGHRVFNDGIEIKLTPKEYELLVYMAKNKGKALSRETILNGVWGYDYYGDLRTVDTHIKRLRLKLKGNSDIIETVRGVGYRLEVKK
ncbi:DNA-binding response regulator, OmpR family, contains REC and winged-helix (wHTH) domain [Caloranaerobacter azorensis DSM 13643]|uniref:DNA-binding response regulator, OmpR family, contains REC and winged-helix (WHTH) domain n=1 Tax=Caloranaerobacter azorensis DSM 13643 TaxID=1121264 RepID=A0A1M5UF25_9FIRM|nr:response regulator transcription factor [Caloranaerobacter azorensis]SHH61634.1 DNA-binding response regulator, OmpR family, contains REC and winged-helix (wHTH) domain [Caloranaerobacter azorensis DSM 13643]